MIKTTLENIARFVVLLLLQVLVVNNLQLHTLCSPYIYIFFILLLPLETPRWLDVLLAFAMGFFMDIFSDTPGMHSFACTLIGYLRYFIIKLFVNEENRISGLPSFAQFGAPDYIKYVATLVLIHHIALFALEAFSLANFGWLLVRIVLSSLVSIALILAFSLFERHKA